MTARMMPFAGLPRLSETEMKTRADEFRDELTQRRSVRQFSTESIPRPLINACLQAAVSAPSGANHQPWHFVVISDATTKHRVPLGAEEEERSFYRHRAPDDWLEALAPLGTDEHKPFLEEAPYLIAVFAQLFDRTSDGQSVKHYYVHESVGIAVGMLITALHHTGLATLTHTPSPMRFLNEILNRPPNERPYLILATGHPAADVQVPDIERKPFDRVVTYHKIPAPTPQRDRN